MDDKAQEVFSLNTKRINKLILLVYSHDFLKPKMSGHEGPSADILRSTVVFLHASFEIFLRSLPNANPKKPLFNSWADITRALRGAGINDSHFEPIRGFITAFLKRRHRIVHHADFSLVTNDKPDEWSIIDGVQLCMWLCAVSAFVCQVYVVSVDSSQLTKDSASAAYRGHMASIDKMVDVFKQMLAITKLSSEDKHQGFVRLTEVMQEVASIVQRDPLSFLSADELSRYT